MKYTRVSTYKPLFFVLAISVLFAVSAGLPEQTFALEITNQTRQVLPPSGASCPPVATSLFTPYIYNGTLQSFDFVVADASYVAVGASVGESRIPFSQMSRRITANGSLLVHVDMASMPLVRDTLVTITLLSAKTGSPVCLMTAIAHAPSTGAAPISGGTTSVNSVSSGTSATSGSGASTVVKPSTNTSSTTPAKPVKPATSTVKGSASSSAVVGSLAAFCKSSPSAAYQLWLGLLILFALIVAALLWFIPTSWTWAGTPERVATIILVLLVLLLAFWYFSVDCRAAAWMPLLAFLVAIVGLLSAFWNHPRVTKILSEQTTTTNTKSTTIITPPPTKK